MQVDDIIDSIDSLRPVSPMVERVMKIVRDPDSSMADLVEVIKFDDRITANLLKTCNSAYFNLPNRIASVQQAVTYFGMEKVASLAMLQTTAGNFRKDQDGYDLAGGELWRAAITSALIAQEIAEKKQLGSVSLIFTASLLKDIGKVVLNDYIKSTQSEIFERLDKQQMSFTEAEEAVFGIDHAELGARVAEKWNFNFALVDLIRHHHTPLDSEIPDLSACVVYIADTICMMIGVGVGSDGLTYRHYQAAIDKVGLSAVDIQDIIAGYWDKIESIEEMMNLSQEG